MTEIRNYRIDFIKRTKEILEGNFPAFEEEDREVTFLMNCLLGLIVTVSENEKKKKAVFNGNIDAHFLTLIPEKIGFVGSRQEHADLTDTDWIEPRVRVYHKDDLGRKSKQWLINKIRNGIAHQNIEGINADGAWVGVRLWNTNSDSQKDFEVVFAVGELKRLALALADEYLEEEKE